MNHAAEGAMRDVSQEVAPWFECGEVVTPCADCGAGLFKSENAFAFGVPLCMACFSVRAEE
jgi:hypothetical protein